MLLFHIKLKTVGVKQQTEELALKSDAMEGLTEFLTKMSCSLFYRGLLIIIMLIYYFVRPTLVVYWLLLTPTRCLTCTVLTWLRSTNIR